MLGESEKMESLSRLIGRQTGCIRLFSPGEFSPCELAAGVMAGGRRDAPSLSGTVLPLNCETAGRPDIAIGVRRASANARLEMGVVPSTEKGKAFLPPMGRHRSLVLGVGSGNHFEKSVPGGAAPRPAQLTLWITSELPVIRQQRRVPAPSIVGR